MIRDVFLNFKDQLNQIVMHFFRKKRQILADENRLLKYTRYAVGEVLLIVVGILLALYLNNLNEEKNVRQDQVRILKELISNLNSTITAFERTISTEKSYLSFNQAIIDHLDHKAPYDTILDKSFGTYYWTVSTNPVKGAYEHLKAKGLDLIENDSLRKRISFLFESEFTILKEENQFWSNSFQQNISYPYHIRHFRKYYPKQVHSENYEFAKPMNYEALLDDDYFLSMNTEIISNRRWNIRSLEGLIVKMESLKILINQELEELGAR